MVSEPAMVIAPVLAVKFPPDKVTSLVVVTVLPLPTVVVPLLMVIVPIVCAVPTLTSMVTSPAMTTSAPAAAAVVVTPGTQGLPPEVHPDPDQLHRAGVLHLFALLPLPPGEYVAVRAAADPLSPIAMAETISAEARRHRAWQRED